MEKTRAGFRAKREALGLSQADAAAALGVQQRSVRRWEQPGNVMPPQDAWDWLERMEALFVTMAEQAVAQVEDIRESAGKPPKSVSMAYWRDQAECDALARDPMPYGFANAVTREVARRLWEVGIESRFEFREDAGGALEAAMGTRGVD